MIVPAIDPASPSSSFPELRSFLQDHLLETIVPFWKKNAVDPDGGLNTCLRDDGSVISREKWLWSQWRAVWVFSRLYNQVEQRPEWLELALHVYRFAARHGWDNSEGGWRLLVDPTGAPLRGCESIYVDAFATYGLVELGRATDDAEVKALARRTADGALRRLQQPHETIPHFPYPVPAGARVHGLPMMFSLVLWELGEYLDDGFYRDAANRFSDEIFTRFWRPDLDLIVERVGVNALPLPPPLGTAVVPGHVIEDMWFQIHIARDQGRRDRVEEAARLIRRHAEVGWDREYGGFFLAVDALGNREVGWNFADSKLWWPHTEALYAFLLAYEETRERWCLDWYNRTHDYSFRTFPHSEYGEWTQKMTREGAPFTETVALPVKDPFHLPRSLLLCLEVLGRLSRAPDEEHKGQAKE